MPGAESVPAHQPGERTPPTDDDATVSGAAAGGRVRVTLSTNGDLLGVHIHPGDFVPVDAPGLDNLGDMLVMALDDARSQAEALRTRKAGDPRPSG